MVLNFTYKLTDKNYEEFVSSDVVLVDIYADWCVPCQRIAPLIEELSVEFKDKAKIGKINADENPDTMVKLGIRNLPTLLVYKNGEIVEKHMGNAAKAKLSELINKHL